MQWRSGELSPASQPRSTSMSASINASTSLAVISMSPDLILSAVFFNS
jgi:hypothetical protein